ncbi:pfkB family carbohydrate kinase-like protein [Rhexocercosporidium sp. MPI-PUGE-AT-0058]|nr:pfkB family carbohydrate kinase-like protein [Rhexocercosporidium sp. MPI-PUGE-AT-0058]
MLFSLGFSYTFETTTRSQDDAHSPDTRTMEGEDRIAPDQEIDFCTLGMFIIDEIHYLPPTPPVFNILGGAGSFSALGARLFSPPPLSRTVSWIVDKGSDFPPSLTTQITSWQTSCLIREDANRLTTRGWNGYDTSQNRAFKYTTPKLRLTTDSLTPTLLLSKSFHLICSPTRCIELVTAILRARKALNKSIEKPLFIWEPVPDLCLPTELLNCTNCLPYIDILSPNAHELAGFMGDLGSEIDPITNEVSKPWVERACEQLLGSMPLQSYALVIRCGAQGCYIAKNGGRSRRPSKSLKRRRPANHARGGLTLDMDMSTLFLGLLDDEGSLIREEEVPIDPGIERWLPAYFQDTPPSTTSMSGESDGESLIGKVVDPTGGGNGFLGGLAVALARGRGVVEASCWGSVAASFMIEQVGMPILSSAPPSSLGEGEGEESSKELWNNVSVEERLEAYLKRVGL